MCYLLCDRHEGGGVVGSATFFGVLGEWFCRRELSCFMSFFAPTPRLSHPGRVGHVLVSNTQLEYLLILL